MEFEKQRLFGNATKPPMRRYRRGTGGVQSLPEWLVESVPPKVALDAIDRAMTHYLDPADPHGNPQPSPVKRGAVSDGAGHSPVQKSANVVWNAGRGISNRATPQSAEEDRKKMNEQRLLIERYGAKLMRPPDHPELLAEMREEEERKGKEERVQQEETKSKLV